MLDLIAALARGGTGVPFSAHDPDHAFLVADRVALMKDGALLALGAPEAAITEASLRTLYGVEVRIAELAEDGRPRRVCLPRQAACSATLSPPTDRSSRYCRLRDDRQC